LLGGRPPARILVVDDELDTAQSLALLFRAMGKEVEFAVTGTAALEIARRMRPDMIFVDIGLPDIDGWQLTRRLKAEAAQRPVRIVCISGRSGADDKRRSADAGAEAHLVKPVDPAHVEKLVSEGG